MKILFLGETYRADAITWIEGISKESGEFIQTLEIPPSKSRWLRLLYFGHFFFNLLKLRFHHSYDIVLAERATSYGFFSLFVKTKLRVVAQQGITDAYPESGISGFYKRILQKIVYRNVDLIHAWGKVMTGAMLKSGAKPEKIMILPKGINLNKFRFNENRMKLSIATGIVTRSLTPVYRHSDIIEAVKLLKQNEIEFQLHIVGNGPFLSDLQRIAESSGVNKNVVFMGKVDNNDLPDLLNQSNLYIAMPETEGVSASLFEAMACGCFPIVSDLPANRAFIQSGVNGFLIEVGNVDQLAAAIVKYLEAPISYQKAIIQNRKFIEREVNLDHNMKLIYQTYLKLLGKYTKNQTVN